MIAKRTEQIWLKPNKNIGRVCHLSKNLFNQANYIIKQNLDKNGKWIRYNELDKILKKESENYKTLNTQTAQQILRLLDKSWLSYFRALKEWKKNPNKFKEIPKSPRYKKKNGEHILIFTNQQCKIKDNKIKFPKKFGLEVKIRLENETNLREIRILPKGVGYVCEIVYEKEIESKEQKDSKRIVGIDLGSKNIITMCNNIGKKPIVIKDNGKGIKSINQYFAKKYGKLQNKYSKQKIKTGKKIRQLYTKWQRKKHDYLHKLSRFIVNWCNKNKIDTIVFGYNKDWKQRSNIGRKNNQIFVNIPFMLIIQRTKYKAEEIGIKVIEQEESHTSKCSFLDKEPIEHREKYVGKRKSRNFFRSKNGRIIHADVNAGYNIIEKAIPGAIPLRTRKWIGGCGLHPIRYYLLSNKYNSNTFYGL